MSAESIAAARIDRDEDARRRKAERDAKSARKRGKGHYVGRRVKRDAVRVAKPSPKLTDDERRPLVLAAFRACVAAGLFPSEANMRRFGARGSCNAIRCDRDYLVSSGEIALPPRSKHDSHGSWAAEPESPPVVIPPAPERLAVRRPGPESGRFRVRPKVPTTGELVREHFKVWRRIRGLRMGVEA